MEPISIGLGAIGLASKLYGGIKGAISNKAEEDQLNKRFEENEAFFNNRANRDYLETNAAKGAVEQIRKKYDKDNKTIDSKAAATGATAESTIAAKSKNNENYNDAINKINQTGTFVQDRAESRYRRGLSELYREKTQLNRNKAENAARLVESGGNLMTTAAEIGGLSDKTVNEILDDDKQTKE